MQLTSPSCLWLSRSGTEPEKLHFFFSPKLTEGQLTNIIVYVFNMSNMMICYTYTLWIETMFLSFLHFVSHLMAN